MLAAASPFPREDTTPPVMKMCLGVRPSMILSLTGGGRQQTAPLFQILLRVHTERVEGGLDRFDADAVFERPQLLERFRPFERRRFEGSQHQRGPPGRRVQT